MRPWARHSKSPGGARALNVMRPGAEGDLSAPGLIVRRGSTGRMRSARYQEPDLVGKIRAGRVEQGLGCRIILVGLRDQRDTGVLVLSLRPIAELIDHGFEAVIAHLEGVLNDQS